MSPITAPGSDSQKAGGRRNQSAKEAVANVCDLLNALAAAAAVACTVRLLPESGNAHGEPAEPDVSASPEILAKVMDAPGVVPESQSPKGVATMTIGTILESVGRRSYGPLILLLGLIAISPLTVVPGATWLVAALTLAIAVQMTLGLPNPWLPKRVLAIAAPCTAVIRTIDFLRPMARAIDAVVKPRFCFFADPPFVIVIGLACCIASLICFPLGFVPFGPVAPGIAIILFGIGMTARDGLVLAFGMVVVFLVGLLLWRLPLSL